MRSVAVDIGNTNTRFAIFDGDRIVEVRSHIEFQDDALQRWLQDHQVEKAIISNVNQQQHISFGNDVEIIEFNSAISAGITSYYETQETLGQDRWAKMIAVSVLDHEGSTLVIDAGTCLTTDLMHVGKRYMGGTISPGMQMRFKALNTFTNRLPLVNWEQTQTVENGTTTTKAIIAGVVNGYVNEVMGHITEMNLLGAPLNVYLTGGDSGLLWSRLKNSIFAPQIILDPLLVFKGLNEVIKLEKCS